MPGRRLLALGVVLLTVKGGSEDDSVIFIQMNVGSLPFSGDWRASYPGVIQAEEDDVVAGSTEGMGEFGSSASSAGEESIVGAYLTRALEAGNDTNAFYMDQAEGKDEGSENPQEVFKQFDVDSSGELKFSELTEFLRVHWTESVTPAQVRKIIRKSDKDVNWAVSYREFLGCARRPAACDVALPQSLQHLSLPRETEFERQQEDAPSTQLSSTGPVAPVGPLAEGGLASIVLPKWPPPKPKMPPEVKECNDLDREILSAQGLRVWGQEGAVPNTEPDSVDHLRMQTLHIGGAWARTLLLPGSCRSVVAHGADVDRGAYADCLQETLNLTVPCGKCQADYLQTMVRNCADKCMHNLNSDVCVDCAEPLTLLECIEGLERFEELDLASLVIKGAPLPAGSVEDDEAPTDVTDIEDEEVTAGIMATSAEPEAHEMRPQPEDYEPAGTSEDPEQGSLLRERTE